MKFLGCMIILVGRQFSCCFLFLRDIDGEETFQKKVKMFECIFGALYRKCIIGHNIEERSNPFAYCGLLKPQGEIRVNAKTEDALFGNRGRLTVEGLSLIHI